VSTPRPRNPRALVVIAVLLLAACSGDDGAGAPMATTADGVPTTADSATATTTGAMSTAPTLPEPPAGPLPSATLSEPIVIADQPVDVAVRPGTEIVYVAERFGTVRRIDGDELSTVLLDLSDRVLPAEEEGLLGLVFSPDGSLVYFNKASEGRTTITEYRVESDGDIDASSRRIVFEFDQPYDNHNGGDLLFGPDGMLYVFSGDGGFVADPQRRALDLSSPHGKILRIDPTADGDRAYSVPADNPFVGVDGALGEIWSYGLRNPWRGSFDPVTGDLWIGDVGDFAWEEINVAWADEGAGRGVSFGWSAFEGSERFNEDQPADGHEFPFFEYPHGDEGCSVTVGERYRGTAIDDLDGWFVFADFCTGIVRALEVTEAREPRRIVEFGTVPLPVSISRGVGDELLVVSIEGGIHRLVPA
jgi:glucose/arabinose dehydrogenase